MKRFLVVLPALVVLVMGAGCIKEDRSECPCRLFLDFTDVDTSSIASADILMTSEEGFEFVDVVESGYFADYMIKVPSHQISLQVLAGAGHCLSSDMSVVIPYGEECPKLFRHDSVINADSEVVKERIRLRKNHCVLTVQVEAGEDYPFKLTVKGRVDGYGSNLKPTVGDFSCRAVPDDSGQCVVVIPRQLDSSLALEVDDGTGSVKTFAVGESIVAGGYDWEAEDLDDVTVTLDYSLTEIALEIIEWTEESVHEVII
ncbi:MAG: hypothetical protein IKY95_07870 [Bacteroidales bacterium]|nr:hypothetical protein [Bacteroidales bacterium]